MVLTDEETREMFSDLLAIQSLTDQKIGMIFDGTATTRVLSEIDYKINSIRKRLERVIQDK